MIVACPTCQKEVEWSETNPFRPFCSKVCQLIDLGEWADGKRAIPASEDEPMSEELYQQY
jgi:endogenous inhibitor of DNA gyrase (YacG/DUF329 family)